MKHLILVVLIFGLASICWGSVCSTIYIAPMAGNFDSFLSTEIMKKRLPVTLSVDANTADCVLSGGAENSGENRKGFAIPFTGVHGNSRSKYSGAVTLISHESRTIIWGADVDNKKMKQAAEDIVKQLHKDIYQHRGTVDTPTSEGWWTKVPPKQ